MDHDPYKGQRPGVSPQPSPTPIRPVQPDASIVDSAQLEVERLATLTAELARLGAGLVELRSGAFVIAVGGVQRHFDDFSACRQFYKQIGGRA